jgi:hypothetical protein
MDLLSLEYNQRILILVSNIKERLQTDNEKLNIIKLSLEMIDIGDEIQKKRAISTIADFCGKQRLMDLFDEAVNIKELLDNIPEIIDKSLSVKVPDKSASRICNDNPEQYDIYAQICYADTYIPNERLRRMIESDVDIHSVMTLSSELRNIFIQPDSFRKVKNGSETMAVDTYLQLFLSCLSRLF